MGEVPMLAHCFFPHVFQVMRHVPIRTWDEQHRWAAVSCPQTHIQLDNTGTISHIRFIGMF